MQRGGGSRHGEIVAVDRGVAVVASHHFATTGEADEDVVDVETLVQVGIPICSTGTTVVVAEGDKMGKNVFELKDYVEEHMPEYDVRVSVLGHMQRGGSPTAHDRILASRLGAQATLSLIDGKKNILIGNQGPALIEVSLDVVTKTKKPGDTSLIQLARLLSV